MIIEIIVVLWLYMVAGLIMSEFISGINDRISGEDLSSFDLRRSIILWPWCLVVVAVKIVIAKKKV